jgi:hypothetical protein
MLDDTELAELMDGLARLRTEQDELIVRSAVLHVEFEKRQDRDEALRDLLTEPQKYSEISPRL